MAEEPAGPVSRALWVRALRAIPGGVNSPVRSFRSVGGQPYFVQRAQGAYVWDADGRRLIDYVQSYGASILGHAHPAVTRAVQQAAARGASYGAPTEAEVRLAEAVAERVEGCEQLRLVSSGTEAAMTAVRLARAATGRQTVVKFDGCYHGHSDALLAGSGSGVATLSLPGSAGVPTSAVAHTVVLPYNQVPELGADVACVIVEPVAANMGLVPPAPGFLEGLRQECSRAGALLVFDEVITGFRLGPGGASERFSVRPDLWCFGKVLGGGLPIGAVGGPRELMEELAPLGPVYQAGTLSGNPLATAAGLATLSALDRGSYQALEATAARLASGLAAALSSAGVTAQVPVVGPLVGLFFSPRPVTDFEGAKAADTGAYARFFHGLLGRGVALAPGAYEAVFPSLAHSDQDVEASVEAAAEVAAEMTAGKLLEREGR